jgi:predicted transcriptional regulator
VISIKEEARQIIDRLPDECSWEDVMYEMYVRKSIEAGLADSAAGRVHTLDEVCQRFGIKPWK